jgi:hypothetical protein
MSSTDPFRDQAPTPTDRKKLIGCAVALAILVVALVVASYAAGLWGSGQMPANP